MGKQGFARALPSDFIDIAFLLKEIYPASQFFGDLKNMGATGFQEGLVRSEPDPHADSYP